jgi:anhydro-N-acetylmuramic acid kinase
MNPTGIDAADVQASLCALSAKTIADAIRAAAPETSDVLVCGGGVHNATLMRQLRAQLGNIDLSSTASEGLDPDWVEAAAFAWLAMRRLQGLPGTLPSVTGARAPVLLGEVHLAA